MRGGLWSKRNERRNCKTMVRISKKGGRTSVHYEERSGRPSVVSDYLIQNVDQISVKDAASQFQNFLVNFHKFHALCCTRLSQLG
jgi:hypothetical protein